MRQTTTASTSRVRKRAAWSAVLVVSLSLIAGLVSCRLRRLDEPNKTSASASHSASVSTSVSAVPTPSVSASITPPAAASSSATSSATRQEEPDGPAGALVIGIGGIGSEVSLSTAVQRGVRASVRALANAADPLDAAVSGVVVLEDDASFNAGRGSAIRFDGSTVQMDAALMDSEGRLGVVAAVSRVRNPIQIAREVANTLQPLVVGGGAVGLARTQGHDPFDLTTPRAHRQRELALLRIGARDAGTPNVQPGASSEPPSDTIAGDGGAATPDASLDAGADSVAPEPPHNLALLIRTPDGAFVAAASDGGRPAGLPGYVGPVAVPGAAIFAGPQGAVIASGPANQLIHQMLARSVYERMLQVPSPRQAVAWGLAQLPDGVEVGLAAVDRRAFHIQAQGPMAWATWSSKAETLAEGDAGGREP